MRPGWRWAWSSSGVWIAPVAVAVAIWYAGQSLAYTADPWIVAHSAAGFAPLMLTIPLAAAGAAWEGSRWRHAGWTAIPWSRDGLASAVPLLAPVTAAGVLASLAGMAAEMRTGTGTFLPDVRFLAPAVLLPVAWTVAAFALGTSLNGLWAVPAALGGAYAALVLPITVTNPVWLRHLTATRMNGACCETSADVDWRALAAPSLVALGLLAASWLRLNHHGAIPAALMVGAAVAGGALLAHGLGRGAQVPRDPSALVCAGAAPVVCVWPEHANLAASASGIAAGMTGKWAAAGLPVPDRFTERLAPASPASHSFALSRRSSDPGIRQAFAMAMLPPVPPPCAASPSRDAVWRGADAYPLLLAWLMRTGGSSAAEIAGMLGGEGGGGRVLAAAEQAASRPAAEQRVWFARNLTALSRCDVPAAFDSAP